MKKKLAILLAVLMLLPTMFITTGCNDSKQDEITGTSALEERNTTNKTTTTTVAETTTATTSTTSNSGISADFKAAMDSYEAFMDEYVAFMKKYKDNPGDLSLLTDYADYISKYADFVADFEKWDDVEMNAQETAYYIDVQARVSKKLLEVSY